MANTTNSRSDFITRQRQAVTDLLNAVVALNNLRATWDAGMNVWITDADNMGENAGLDKASITAIFTTMDAINALLATGHRTNLEMLRK